MTTDVPVAIPAPAIRKSRAPAILGVLAAAALAAGAAMAWKAGEGRVDAIRVSRHSVLPEAIVGSPDYYVTVRTRDGKSRATPGYDDTPIGNGLDFKLPKPLDMAEVAHVELMDEDLGDDDIRDRVDVRGRVLKGQEYEFELVGPASPWKSASYTALGGGGALLVIAAILLVRSHAV
jgi:hypothetical protein